MSNNESNLKAYTIDKSEILYNKEYQDDKQKPINKILIKKINYSGEYKNNEGVITPYKGLKFEISNFKLFLNNGFTEIKKIIKTSQEGHKYNSNEGTKIILSEEQISDFLENLMLSDYGDITINDIIYEKNYENDNGYPTNKIFLRKIKKDDNIIFEFSNYKLTRNNGQIEIKKTLSYTDNGKPITVNDGSILYLQYNNLKDLIQDFNI